MLKLKLYAFYTALSLFALNVLNFVYQLVRIIYGI